MSALLEKMLKKEDPTEIEICILWVADDAETWEAGNAPYEQAVKAAEELEDLRRENEVMYAAILEAAEFGSGRCKVELQRIARKDAGLS